MGDGPPAQPHLHQGAHKIANHVVKVAVRRDGEGAAQVGPVLPPCGVDLASVAPLLLPPLQPGAGDSAGAADDPAAGMVDTWPLASRGYITQPLLVGSAPGDVHPGLDIAVPRNSHVRAAGPGVVRVAGDDPVYGLHVVIDHGRGMETLYGHAAQLFVAARDTVRRGQLIAFSGSTGRSSAPHLHFEVRRDGIAVDPLTYVRQP